MATYEDEIINPSLPLLQKLHLSWAIRSGAALGGGSIRADASAGVATARFTLQLTLGLVPKLCVAALAAAVLHPELVGALSDPVLCLIGMQSHIIVLPWFSSRRIRSVPWLIEGGQEVLSINSEYFYMSSPLELCMMYKELLLVNMNFLAFACASPASHLKWAYKLCRHLDVDLVPQTCMAGARRPLCLADCLSHRSDQ
jgi:hypothetical protein